MKRHAPTNPLTLFHITSQQNAIIHPHSIQIRTVGVSEQTVRYDVLGVATCSLAVIIMAGQWTTGTSVTRTSEQPWQSTERSTVTVDE